ncbi:MAG: hypothetical protein JO332_15410, partial [Planctomycetaceae bacterium]|nr:hypothetical protein [Planctomycetaceae bacterium]
MPDSCAKHADRAATGTCKRCDSPCCSLCTLDVDGSIYCSLLCFTEQSLATKRKSLRDPALPPATPDSGPPTAVPPAAEILTPEPAPAVDAPPGIPAQAG